MNKMNYLAAVILLMVVGCGTILHRPVSVKTPEVTVSNGAVTLTGDAKVAPTVETKKTDSSVGVPEGSLFVFNEKLGTLSLLVSKATQIVSNRTETAIKGPVAFDPEKPATPKQESDAKAGFWSKLGLQAGLVVGLSAAVFGLVRGWDLVMIGGGAVAASSLFGLFVESHPILLGVLGAGVAVAIIGPILYHTKIKPLETKPIHAD